MPGTPPTRKSSQVQATMQKSRYGGQNRSQIHLITRTAMDGSTIGSTSLCALGRSGSIHRGFTRSIIGCEHAFTATYGHLLPHLVHQSCLRRFYALVAWSCGIWHPPFLFSTTCFPYPLGRGGIVCICGVHFQMPRMGFVEGFLSDGQEDEQRVH